MLISCCLCNEHFTEVPDVLDKHKALRDASGRLINHIQMKHANALPNIQQKVMACMSLASWIFMVREFGNVIVESKEEVDKALAISEETILCMLRGVPLPSDTKSS